MAVGQPIGFLPKDLSEQPLDPVALDRTANLAAHGDTEPSLLAIVGSREGVDDEVAIRVRSAFAVDAVELRATRQALAAGSLAARRVHRWVADPTESDLDAGTDRDSRDI